MAQAVSWRRLTSHGVVFCALLVCGCRATSGLRNENPPCSVVYYFDGAGGGGVLANWGRGVERGFREAGFAGEFINYSWQTGLGAPADQNSSVRYKRARAAEVAAAIARYGEGDPGADISLIGLSAGSAIVVYALEALPPGSEVQDVVLLGASISAQYNLTEALRHVRHRFYVFTSERDEVLGAFVPLVGTADRRYCGRCAAGLYGFHLPPGAGEETRRLYGKIRSIAWRPEFELSGNQGAHLDFVNFAFVHRHIAPLLLHESPRLVHVAAETAEWAATQPAASRPAGS